MSDSTFRAEEPIFLKKLPAELRNDIYELCFTTTVDPDNKVNMATQDPPSHALAQVNKQLYQETKALYEKAARAYYPNHDFYLRIPYGGNAEQLIKSAHKRFDLKRIESLELTVELHSSRREALNAHLQSDGKTWCIGREDEGVFRTDPPSYCFFTQDLEGILANHEIEWYEWNREPSISKLTDFLDTAMGKKVVTDRCEQMLMVHEIYARRAMADVADYEKYLESVLDRLQRNGLGMDWKPYAWAETK